ncbi:MAG: four helix bundle protein [Caldilineaceae bacterium]
MADGMRSVGYGNEIENYRDLRTWQEAHKLVLMVYKASEALPPSEQYGLTSQMRRAAVSVPANIVEGFKRRGIQEKLRFYNIAEASLEELRYFLLLTHDLGYLTNQAELEKQSESVSKLLYRFIESTARKR